MISSDAIAPHELLEAVLFTCLVTVKPHTQLTVDAEVLQQSQVDASMLLPAADWHPDHEADCFWLPELVLQHLPRTRVLRCGLCLITALRATQGMAAAAAIQSKPAGSAALSRPVRCLRLSGLESTCPGRLLAAGCPLYHLPSLCAGNYDWAGELELTPDPFTVWQDAASLLQQGNASVAPAGRHRSLLQSSSTGMVPVQGRVGVRESRTAIDSSSTAGGSVALDDTGEQLNE